MAMIVFGVMTRRWWEDEFWVLEKVCGVLVGDVGARERHRPLPTDLIHR